MAMVGLCATAKPIKVNENTYDGFPNVRHEILNVIGSAKKRVWLVSDFLTDGEIVTALYIARYRRVDVQVLLGAARATNYLSRLNYLKNQKIPVFLRPKDFAIKSPSAVLADNVLVYLNGELDYRAKYRRYRLTVPGSKERKRFATAFTKASQKGLPTVARPRPAVGRKSLPVPRGIKRPPTSRSGKVIGDAYHYGRDQRKVPSGVTTRLPKETIYQRLDRQRRQRDVMDDSKDPPREEADAP